VSSLAFAVAGASAELHAAVPTLNFRLRICDGSGAAVHSILLRCQLQIETRRRLHSANEQERLTDMFGEAARWKQTLRPLLWTQTTIAVPAFQGATEIDLPLTCTYDFEVTAAKYLQSLEGGEVPLLFLFSGTVFAKADHGFQIQQVPWDRETSYRMPVAVWRDLMDSYFPGSAWIRLRRESLDALQRYRARHALASWDEAIAKALDEKEK
jgi:Family of unknown function (DUF6084)